MVEENARARGGERQWMLKVNESGTNRQLTVLIVREVFVTFNKI
jgi:hypothetical protein